MAAGGFERILAFLALLCLSLPFGSSEVVVLQGSTFDAVTSEGFWFIDFYAPWCGYCKVLAPIWEDTSNRYNAVHFAKMDCTVNENSPICHRYGVHSYPTLKMILKGNVLQEFSGQRTVNDFISFCEKIILENPPPTPEPPKEEPVQEVKVEEPMMQEEPKAQLKASEESKEGEHLEKTPPKAAAKRTSYLNNMEGKVVVLNDENFEKETKEGNWFIKFYAPWCGHCKKLAPTWEELGAALKGKVNVGKVDCDAESVCDKNGVRSYPTLKFFVDGHIHEYRDKRTLQTLANFATRMSGEAVVLIDQGEYDTLRKERDLFFLFLQYEGADHQFFEELSKKFMSISNFYASSDPALHTSLGVQKPPALVVSQNGELSFFKGDLTSQSLVEKWVAEHKFPLFSELDSSNAAEILESEEIVVMLVADPDQTEFSQKAKPEMVKAAIQYSREVKQGISRAPVYFVWLNGILWESYVSKNYEVSKAEYPAVFVLRPSLNLYFDTRSTGEKAKVESKAILSLVRDVEKGKVQGKSIGGFIRGIFAGMQRLAKPVLNWVTDHVYIVIGGVIFLTVGLTWILVNAGISEKIEKAE